MNRTAEKRRKRVKPSAQKLEGDEFDREFVIDTFEPLTHADRAQWSRVRRKRGRPKIGLGVEVISVSVERRLLNACDRLAKRKKISRASIVAKGLRAVLAIEGGAG